ncbi:hypothetical protein [Streptomyces antimicrobicus]|uniref:Secreted protein n=1 Tax=Streptomyces antimicrobicus TaxID=2883108 RepID=A0ABS8B1H0_9ACTN|nr:hypothetical protein [Streptomyces antimicrobicus]MCB5178452.1 hypothetical protein [Streptomyces antimicrobicus]
MTQMRGWLVSLVALAALLVFGPLGLYVWASGGADGGSAAAEGGGGPAGIAPRDELALTGCRIDPASRRVVADVRVVGGRTGPAVYVATVEFREGPAGPTTRALVELTPAADAEAIGPVWPPGATPWCGLAGAELSPAPSPTAPAGR